MLCSADDSIRQGLPPTELVLLSQQEGFVSSWLGAEMQTQALQAEMAFLAAHPHLVPVPATLAGFQLSQSKFLRLVDRQALPGFQVDKGPGSPIPTPLVQPQVWFAFGETNLFRFKGGGMNAFSQTDILDEKTVASSHCGGSKTQLTTHWYIFLVGLVTGLL